MRSWICLAVIIVLTGCRGAATSMAVPSSTPMDQPSLFIPTSAKPYTGGDGLIDTVMEALKGTTLGTLKHQDVYLVTESSSEIERFYREHYPTYRIDTQPVESDGATLTLFIRIAGVDGGYLIQIRYRDLATHGRADGLLVVMLVREPVFIR